MVCSPRSAKNTLALCGSTGEHDRGLVVDDVGWSSSSARSSFAERAFVRRCAGRQIDMRERTSIAVPLVVGEQRVAHRAVGRLLQTAVERRRDFEARGVRLRAEAPNHFGAHHLADVRRVDLSLRAIALADDRLRERRLVLRHR